MKKSIKKFELKKSTVSKLDQVQGGAGPIIVSLMTAFCPTRIYVGEDICLSDICNNQ